MSGRLGNKIGEGGCAEVFEWEDGRKIVKLAKPNTNEAALRGELRHCRVAWSSGLPVPRPYGMVECKGRIGAVFERVDGESLLQRFVRMAAGKSMPQSGDGDVLGARLTARLLHDVHARSAPDMPDQRDMIKHDIRRAAGLPEAEKDAAIARLDRLPRKSRLCHGDPNPGNILLRAAGDAVLIDWNNASVGNPEADLAEYVLLVRCAVLPPFLAQEAASGLDAVREASVRAFVEQYERLSGIGYADVEPWLPVIAARKLAADGISEEEKRRLIGAIRR